MSGLISSSGRRGQQDGEEYTTGNTQEKQWRSLLDGGDAQLERDGPSRLTRNASTR